MVALLVAQATLVIQEVQALHLQGFLKLFLGGLVAMVVLAGIKEALETVVQPVAP